ncbi:DUF3310 domain-containing protein [Corynebacterium coyleae]|uniref:DUF3310 domain-containing protein n=1 Tax=Corynebacterium coyleae TaxID=53374 RepID=UPI001CCC039F|nr:DUF3310 domain-containing protein [Corynebacterium coyleae]UBI10011.1 DUF3310 domain-containing protein [Corynebacterium coyleae]
MADSVDHPDHYQTDSGLEAIDVIEAFFPDNFHLGNAFKYLARAGKKTEDPVEDLEKAVWYIQRFMDTQVYYVITPKGKAVAALTKAGIECPFTETIAYEASDGTHWYLEKDGRWRTNQDTPSLTVDTEEIIQWINIFKTRIVGW